MISYSGGLTGTLWNWSGTQRVNVRLDLFSGIGWVWKDNMGKIQLMGTRNLRRRETALHSELEALKWALEALK
ncbi:hypothetical protein DY000_02016699 [Brassica cretica]|uniref:RNase H type-1 domain-containing protein n=1 Tax=Brassica cretica TaxID=69181 RepID=A0ABQ7CQ92_BRACR|nr:hypothetical protein DY000_02016699 [Brassica cretica]